MMSRIGRRGRVAPHFPHRQEQVKLSEAMRKVQLLKLLCLVNSQMRTDWRLPAPSSRPDNSCAFAAQAQTHQTTLQLRSRSLVLMGPGRVPPRS